MIKCQTVLAAMEEIAPRRLAESWDNPGLLTGNGALDVERILICLDVTEQVVEQAIKNNCQLIISHHPLIFRPLKTLRTDLPLGALLQKICAHNIAVFSAHTNFDSANEGINDLLCQILNLKNVKPLSITLEDKFLKGAVFVPPSHEKALREAIASAGAGHIGNYSSCSFSICGKGRFLPLAGTNPFIGQEGQLETVDEIKIEFILPEKLQKKVTSAILRAHPYEEPAYDFYPLSNQGPAYGLGRIGSLEEALPTENFLARLKRLLPENCPRFIDGGQKTVQKIALCSGAGAEFIDRAKFSGADLYLTSDVKYHEARHAEEIRLSVVDGGHFGTEYPAISYLAEKLRLTLGKNASQVEIITDQEAKSPFHAF